MHEATVDYYVVRIYRKQPDSRSLVGLVETRGGEQRAFHDIDELWRALGGPCAEKAEATEV